MGERSRPPTAGMSLRKGSKNGREIICTMLYLRHHRITQINDLKSDEPAKDNFGENHENQKAQDRRNQVMRN